MFPFYQGLHAYGEKQSMQAGVETYFREQLINEYITD